MSAPLVEVDGLAVTIPAAAGRAAVVDGVSFSIAPGETLALVGESGCGKSMTALAMMRLVQKPALVEQTSRIVFEGRDLLTLSVPEMRALRGSAIGMIFQEPMTSLNPVTAVGDQVVEAIRLHESVSRPAARARVVELFQHVGIPEPERRLAAYPHQLSGGLKQRVMIAMAIAGRPRLLIADEPTTALDVTVQAQILELLRGLQEELDTAVLLITHDFGVVNEIADRVAVMYAGHVVEEGDRRDLLTAPRHPYSQGLLQSIPRADARGGRLEEIKGVVPRPGEWPAGCRFATRCPRAFEPCQDVPPEAVPVNGGHAAWCHAVAREMTP